MKKKFSIIFLIAILIISNMISFTAGKNYSRLAMYSTGEEFGLSKAQADKLIFVENYINQNYLQDVTEEELYTGQLKGMVKALNDPYSEYLTKKELADMMEDTSGKFFGIGVYITSIDGFVKIVAPIKNTPAEEAGLLPGDIILKVNGTEILDGDVSKASELIKGKKGSKVTLTILREVDGKNTEIEIKVKRDEINIITVNSDFIDEDILYVSISEFKEQTYNEFMEAMKKIKPDTKGMILDLRSNPGGLMSTSTQIADALLPEGLIVYTERKGGIIDDEIYSDEKMIDIPMVLLVNGGSASASEILSGALRDYDRAKIIGEKTFGKGIVQSIDGFADGDGIKLTISEYFTPKGIEIHKKGIEPDIEVKLKDPAIITGIENLEKDDQLKRAIEEIKKQK